jgi:hypothetical protein
MCVEIKRRGNATIAVCEYCSKEFKRIASVKRKHCSKKCFLNSFKVEFTCEFCEKISTLTKWKAANKKFCSIKCSSESIKQDKRKILICHTCEKPFIVMGFLAKKAKYCSIICCNKSTTKYNKPKTKIIKKECKNCKKNYEVWNYRQNSSFCSRECKHNYGRFFGVCKRCSSNFFEEQNVVKDNLNRKYFCSNCIKFVASCHNSGFQLDVYDYLSEKYKSQTIDFNTHIKFEKRIFWPDIIINKKIIIECQGDYYHCNPSFYDKNYLNVKRNMYAYEIWEKDEKRRKFLNDNGYEVYFIWENDWKIDKDSSLREVEKVIYEIQKN